jgi:GNAT superfamily N-acetyltransferase
LKIRSLGYQTDLFFPEFDGVIVDRGHYLVVRTPHNPGYYWGNFLLFSEPPSEADHERWIALFQREIGVPPEISHQAFGWDSREPGSWELESFLEDGFELSHTHVLTATQLHAPRKPSLPVDIGPLRSREDWEIAIENQVASRDPESTEAGYRLFRQRQMARYRAMAVQGLGAWYGAFARGRLVADLGIFKRGEVGRYQAVETHPDFRRRGIASNLVFQAAELAKRDFGIRTLVIVADADSPAEGMYRSIGFAFQEHQFGLEKSRSESAPPP